MGFDAIQYTVDDHGVGTVTLNRPSVLNAYSLRMRDELFELFGNLRHDDELRVVVVRGAGRAFCAGADLTEFGTAPSPFVARRVRFARDVWGSLRRLPMPSIAALHGHVIGTGLELALQCDVRIAAVSSRLRMPEMQLGLLPVAGGTQTLPRAVGTHTARRLLFLGETFSAADAANTGIVDRVVGDEEIHAAAYAMARALARAPRDRLTAIVRLLRFADRGSLMDAIDAEQALRRLSDATDPTLTRSLSPAP